MNKATKNKLLNIVRTSYEDTAKEFSDTRNYIWPELKKLIKPAKTVLDLGCGNGRLFELFTPLNNFSSGKIPRFSEDLTGVNYTGIEQSHALVALAKDKYPNGKFIQGDILDIDKLVKQKFDLILLIAVLPHIPSDELRLEFLQKIKNNLAPGGELVITIWNLHQSKHHWTIAKYNFLKLIGLNKMDFNDILFKGFNTHTPRYYHAFTEQKLKILLLAVGFKINKLYSDDKNIYAICKISLKK